MNKIFSVTEINNRIKNMIDDDTVLSQVCIRGELSNYKVYPSGHWYFSLKDESCTIRCVMFKGESMRVRYRPENGMSLIVIGRVSVFPRDGQYQLYCTELEPDGLGALYAAFEQLKEKLSGEGLFDPRHKKPVPMAPDKIAVVTSPAGAAVRDIIRITGQRFPYSKIVVVPVRVQGAEAPGEIAEAIALVNALSLADVIITGRGGGSLEDLWAFNEECVARAIYHSDIPVISAVGHEPDMTIADFVADVRASTPSNAAELAVPDGRELYAAVQGMRRAMTHAMERILRDKRRRVENAASNRLMQSPGSYIAEKRMTLDFLSHRFSSAFSGRLAAERARLSSAAASLDALSPLKVLSRGYSVTRGPGGHVVTDAGKVKAGDALRLTLSRGEIECRVTEVKE